HEPVTAARTLLTAENATVEIDRVLSALLKERKPVYINLPVDVAAAKAEKPSLPLKKENSTSNTSDQEILNKIQESLKNAKKPIVITGHEIISFGLEKTVTQFISKTKLPITTLNFGKSSVDEALPSFLGIYNGTLSEPNLKEFVESADFILMLGVKLTDSSTGAFTHHLNENKVISLNIDEGKIFNERIQNFDFEFLISSLLDLSEI
ncbi:alpha-keto acid decarboxylase family protein, partial [Lactococcus lactis]|nr:alpha-keto acid decarboxylase family protein [Lactococcus lactis]